MIQLSLSPVYVVKSFFNNLYAIFSVKHIKRAGTFKEKVGVANKPPIYNQLKSLTHSRTAKPDAPLLVVNFSIYLIFILIVQFAIRNRNESCTSRIISYHVLVLSTISLYHNQAEYLFFLLFMFI